MRTHYTNWLRDHDYVSEAEVSYQGLLDIPEDQTTKPLLRMAQYGYGMLFLKLEQYDAAVVRLREVLKTNGRHQMAHDGLARAEVGLGAFAEHEGRREEAKRHFVQAEREFRQAIYWAGKQDLSQGIFYTHLAWFYLDRGRYSEALKGFESALNEDPEFFGNYWGVGRALMGLGEFQLAANALRAALEKATGDLQPPASEEIPKLLAQCQGVHEDTEHPPA
jgi:tetratricopeptide (TPR) repeat protein